MKYLALILALFLIGCGGSNPVQPVPDKVYCKEGAVIVELPDGSVTDYKSHYGVEASEVCE